MMSLLSVFVVLSAVLIAVSPFPHWAGYAIVWRAVLFEQWDEVGLGIRIVQALRLAVFFATLPFWSAAWWIDEIVFAAYRSQAITAPVFCMGQPRSGTTYMHRLLATDNANFRSIRYVEWRFPYICVQLLIRMLGLTQFVHNLDYWQLMLFSATAKETASKMHRQSFGDFEEDYVFFEECLFHGMLVFTWYPYRSVLKHVDDFPGLPRSAQQHILGVHKKTIQKMLWIGQYDENGAVHYPQRFLSKEPTTMRFEYFKEVYPDAKFLFCLRDPNDTLPSIAMLCGMSIKCKTGLDIQVKPRCAQDFFKMQVGFYKYMTQQIQRNASNESLLNVSYDINVKKVLGTMRYVYKFFNMDMSEKIQAHARSVEEEQKKRDKRYDTQEHKLDPKDPDVKEMLDQYMLVFREVTDTHAKHMT
eukprot:TRINITY_DN20789_c0_g1_i1.p1 TRINITY_DN20789_c0_g1~~TRINITY_DN20789_c0_g1_i1.p1  ORF type:complete len:415 (-),score=63.62 TRINITY_DN20789_c0_g1_i1:147-1391(-)